MGKRKRRVHRPPIAPLSSPDVVPCSSRLSPLSTEQYPWHSPGYHYSTYHGKNSSPLDHQIPLRVGSNRWTSELGYNTERIQWSNTAMEVMPWDDEKMVCGTCERLLRQKHPLGSGVLSIEPSVVAVLVCGHFFHADCLEQRTPAGDAGDPPCPLCLPARA